jgi:hypothetical protein
MGQSPESKTQYIKGVLNSYFRPIFLSQKISNKQGYWGWDNGVQIKGNWSFWEGPLFKPRQDIYKNLGHLEDEVYQYEGAWATGKVFCIFQEPGNDWEKDESRFLLFSPDFVKRRVLMQLTNDFEARISKKTPITKAKPTKVSNKPTQSGKHVKGVKDGSYYSLRVPAQWNTSKFFKTMWTIIFGIIKVMITVL